MKKLFVTAPSEDGHYHVAYGNTEEGYGAIAPGGKDRHTHELIWDPARPARPPAPAIPPEIDPMTGMPVMVQDPETGEVYPDPGTPEDPGDPGKETGSWIVSPGEDGHMHEDLVEYPAEPDKKKVENEGERISECLSLWREALSLTEECRKKGRESEGFYKGDGQWDPEVKRTLNALDRAALTINEVAPNIDTLIGYQVEQRTDFRFLPQGGGDQRVADMLNIAVKKIVDNCFYPREETKVFKDMCVPGLGVFQVYMDFESNFLGDIKIKRFPWDDVHYGPHEQEDLSDCEYEVLSRMQSIAKLKQVYKKKADEIEKSYKGYLGQYPDVEKLDNGVNGTNTDYRYAKKLDDQPYTVDGTFPLVDVQKKQFRLVQVTQKVYEDVTVVFSPDENFFHTAYDWKEEDIAAASELPGFQAMTQTKTRVRITRFCGGVMLSDENPADVPLHDFYTVPAYAYRQNGEFWGKVEAAKDPQREINKRRSQMMDTMNRLGAAVYYVEDNTFKNPAEKEKFKKKRSAPGSVFDVNDIGRTPKLEEGAELPASLVNIMQMDQATLQRLMNVIVEQGGANESGTMFLEKKKGRLTGNQFLFDNLSFSKQKLGKIIVALLQRYYGPERIQELLDAQYSIAEFQLGGQDYASFTKEEIIEMLEDADLLEYDVIVTESSFAPTTRLGIAKVLFELIQQGAQIPPELALEFIDMPDEVRTRINGQLQQQSEAAAQSEQASQDSEVVKTLVGKGQYTVTPERAQELGLIPVGPESALASGQESSNNNEDEFTQDTEYANNLASALAG